MGLGPFGFAGVVVAVAQEERGEPGLGAAQVVHRIGAGAADVADGFVRGVGNVDGLELPGTMEPGELEGVAFVGLDPFSRFLGNERGGHHRDLQAEPQQMPGQHESGRPGLVNHLQPAEFSAKGLCQPPQGAFDVGAGRRAGPVKLRLAGRLGPPDRNCFLVHVQSDVIVFAHGVVVGLSFNELEFRPRAGGLPVDCGSGPLPRTSPRNMARRQHRRNSPPNS